MQHLCIALAKLVLELGQVAFVKLLECLGSVRSCHNVLKDLVFIHVFEIIFRGSHSVQLILCVL